MQRVDAVGDEQRRALLALGEEVAHRPIQRPRHPDRDAVLGDDRERPVDGADRGRIAGEDAAARLVQVEAVQAVQRRIEQVDQPLDVAVGVHRPDFSSPGLYRWRGSGVSPVTERHAMTKSILLIVAGTTIGTAAVALPSLDLMPPVPWPRRARPRHRLRPSSSSPGCATRRPGCSSTPNHLVVANDEDRVDTTLRVYDLRAPGAPVATIDATAALAPEGADAEVDLEGLTRFGSRFALIGSHSLKGDDGEPAPSRRRLIAFELSGTAPRFTLAQARALHEAGRRRPGVLRHPAGADQVVRPRQAKLGAKFGGLSIEALSASATPGELLIGLRSPLGPGDTAIVLPLKNAAAVLDTRATPAFARRSCWRSASRACAISSTTGAAAICSWPASRAKGGTFALWSWAGPTGATPPRKVLDIPNEAGHLGGGHRGRARREERVDPLRRGRAQDGVREEVQGRLGAARRQVVPRPPRRSAGVARFAVCSSS